MKIEEKVTDQERIEKLAELSKLAIGSRTLKKFAVQSGHYKGHYKGHYN